MITASQFASEFQKFSGLVIKAEAIEKVVGVCKGKTAEQITQMAMGTSVRSQFTALTALYCKAAETSQNPAVFDPADLILSGQAEKVRKFGEKAYPLSEKQIRLIVDKTIAWLG